MTIQSPGFARRATFSVPKSLHDVLGETTSKTDLFLIFIAATAISLAFVFRSDFGELSWWRVTLAVLLVADIAAGAVANLTRGTNDFYLHRPFNRWIFIAIHLHVLILAWALEAPMTPAWGAWGLTLLGASIVNLCAGRPSQATWAGLCLALGATVVLWQASPHTPALTGIYLLFLFKVVFAFGVDHYPEARETISEGFVGLNPRNQSQFEDILLAAFQKDPLFTGLFSKEELGQTIRPRALVRFLLRMNQILGNQPQAYLENGQIQAVYLLEKPLSPPQELLALCLALFASPPLLIYLGLKRTQWLNNYLVLTRKAMPKGPHHYLMMVAVAPHRQGQGLGRKLLVEIDAQVHAELRSQGLGLDTENPDNLSFYQHLGFELRATQALDEKTTAYSLFKAKGDS